ncbi:MAG: Hsp20/alpha crystallin family protein [Desulfobacteraceae bacterium]
MEYIEIRFGDNFETQTKDERSFQDMFQSVNPMFCLSKRVWKPQMDIFETRKAIIIHAEIAGVKKDDIRIEVSHKAVKISGHRESIQPEHEATYRLAEIQFGDFERVLYLPSMINTEKVCASFSNGFLEITMQKLYVDGEKRTVPIEFG